MAESSPSQPRDRLRAGEVLLENQTLTSPNGRYRFVLDAGGMKLFDGDKLIWTPLDQAADYPRKLTMQRDDVLVFSGQV